VQPPTFVVLVNRTDWIEPGYSKFLENFLRDRLPFKRVPLRILFKSRDSRFHGQEDQHRVVRGRTRAERRPTLVVPPSVRERKRTFRRDRGEAPEAGGDEA
jgi:hypothetical protein